MINNMKLHYCYIVMTACIKSHRSAGDTVPLKPSLNTS